MTITIQPISESSKIFWLNHSDPGAGKTTLIGSGGDDMKILIIRSHLDHADPIRGSGTQEIVVRNWSDNFEAMDYLAVHGEEWDWVWWDCASIIQDVMLQDVYRDVLDRKASASKSRANDRQNPRAQFGPDQGEYRINFWRIMEFISFCIGEGTFNFGVTAHSFWYTPVGADDEAEPAIWPWIQGKGMPQKITGMMNLVTYMEVKSRIVKGEDKEYRVLHTNKNPRWHAKCQFKLPNGESVFGDGDIINPTLPEMMSLIAKGRLHTADDRRAGRVAPTGPRTVVKRPVPTTPARKRSK